MARWDHVSGVVGAAVGSIVYVVDKVNVGTRKPADEIGRTIQRLSARMTVSGRDMAAQRGILEVEDRLPVRWRHSRARVAADLSAVLKSEPRFPPLPKFIPLVKEEVMAGGDRALLLRLYGTLPSGRVLIVGPPGSGKSSAAILLMLDALAHRASIRDHPGINETVPVPVFYTLHGWNPEPGTSTTESAVEFIARRLSDDHPGILTRKSATLLLQTGQISVFLDGLDEIPEHLRPYAISSLSEAPFRMVLMGRKDEAVAASVMGPLRGGVALELVPLHANDSIAYLERHLPSPVPVDWADVVNRLRYSPDSPVSAALVRPFTLSLARHMYTGTRAASGSVKILEELNSVEAIENHLLDRTIEAAYAPRFNSAGTPRYTVGQATEMLTYIASNLRSRGIRDFSWWDIPVWEGSPVGAPRDEAISANRFRFSEPLGDGKLAGGLIAIVLAPALIVTFLASAVFGVPWKMSLIVVGVIAGSMVVVGVISAVVLATSEALNRSWLLDASGGRTVPGDVWFRDKRLSLARSFRHGVFGCLIGVAAGVLFTGSAGDPTLRVVYGSIYGLTLALAAAFSSRFKGILSIRLSGMSLTVTLVLGVCLFAIGSSAITFAGLSVAIEEAPILPWVWICSLISLSAGWLIAGLVTGPPAPNVALGEISRKLSLSRNTAHPLMEFLIDAHDQGLLRSVGPLYQFRHATLQDRLARGRLMPFSWYIRR